MTAVELSNGETLELHTALGRLRISLDRLSTVVFRARAKTLGPERFQQRNLSLNSQARASEFELTLQSKFSVMDADGTEVMADTDATVVKQMENDPRNVVGKAGEISILRIEMRTELAQQIMRRIGFYAASTVPATP